MLLIRIDQTSVARHSARPEACWLASVCLMVWAAAGGSGKPCLATRPAGLETARPPDPAQTLLASVVLTAVFDGVTLEAVQLLRRVKADLLRLARKALQELQEAFHAVIVTCAG